MCVYVYTHGAGKERLLLLLMSEAATHTYVWIICLNVCRLTHPHIHPYTLTYSYRQIHASAYIGTLTYTHLPHTHIAIFKFHCSSIPDSLIKLIYYLFVPLYSQVISNTS